MLLSTDIWVAALIRRVELGGGFAVVARKGDARAGSVLVKVLNLDAQLDILDEPTSVLAPEEVQRLHAAYLVPPRASGDDAP